MDLRAPARSPRRRSALLWLFIGALALQVALAALRPDPRAMPEAMPPAPPAALLRALSLGEPQALSAVLMFLLQSFEDRPGMSTSFAMLDYAVLVQWLERALELDPRSDYPLLLAAQVYAQIPDPGRQRMMLDFVHRAYFAAPERRWRWLAHAAIVARHRLHDDALALRYARDIAVHAPSAPGWARQMHILLLEETGEREQASILLGGLLASGAVRDPAEVRFLTERLETLQRGAPRGRTPTR